MTTAALLLTSSLSAATVLPRAYSHNDYRQARPLEDALDRGFCAAEADVHLRDGDLLVGHRGGDVKPGVNLRKLYLDPLLARARKNGGRVYPGGPTFLLMVEFKSDAEESYSALREQLEPYAEMLTVFTPDRVEEKAVTVVITGHRPNDLLRDEPRRYAGIDGDLGDLEADDETLFPVISDDWAVIERYDGVLGRRVNEERLRRYVRKAHARGRRIRFYGNPDDEEGWELLYDAGVDLINTDRLEALKRWLLKQEGAARRPETTAATP